MTRRDFPSSTTTVEDTTYSAARRAAILSYGEHRGLLMLRVYLDESGHSADPTARVVAVAGGLASLEAWERFEPEWKRALFDFGIRALHMKDFAHFRGEFEGYDEQRRRSLLSRLLPSIMDHLELAIGAAVPMEHYRLSLSPEEQARRIDPYFGCLRECVKHAVNHMHGLSAEEKVELVVADHPEFRAPALELYGVLKDGPWGPRLGSIAFASPSDVVPLQAADLVAYELFQELRSQIDEPERQVRWPMIQLRRHLRDRCRFTFWLASRG